MNIFCLKSIKLLFFLCIFLNYNCNYAQNNPILVDGLNNADCRSLIGAIDAKPKEFLWGIELGKKQEIYVTFSDKKYLQKILKSPNEGIAVDILSKEIYACGKQSINSLQLPKGMVLPPLYLNQVKEKINGEKEVKIEVGKLPKSLINSDFEMNFMLVKDDKICHYQSFLQVPKSDWSLLPMGFFTDTYIQEKQEEKPLIFEKQLQFIVPFPKNKATFNQQDLAEVLDSLNHTNYTIKRIDIRAYASVEGSKEANAILQEKRANAMIDALKAFQMAAIQKNVSTAENWIEFLDDIQSTPFAYLSKQNATEIKKELLKKNVADGLESLLQSHRKAVLTIFLDKKSGFEHTPTEQLAKTFKESIEKSEIRKAIALQKEVFNRINELKLPTDFLNKLEIPSQKKFNILENNSMIYGNILNTKKQEEILNSLVSLSAADPTNGKLRYNICVFKFKLWEKDSTKVNSTQFFEEIKNLRNLKIDNSLVRRMLMNYYIIKANQQYERNDFKGKDFSLDIIKKRYSELNLTDEDLLSLSKFLIYYIRKDDALQLIEGRVNKIDVNEELLFYYINLKLFDENKMQDKAFLKAIQNAVVLNRSRFCKYFNSIANGGASFQLLDDPDLKKFYCNNCGK